MLRESLTTLPVEVDVDEAGNLWAVLRGERNDTLLVGSHLDSVPKGGWLDGENRLARYRKDAEVELRIDQAACLVGSHVDTQLLEQPEDRASLYCARGVVVSGDENHGSVW